MMKISLSRGSTTLSSILYVAIVLTFLYNLVHTPKNVETKAPPQLVKEERAFEKKKTSKEDLQYIYRCNGRWGALHHDTATQMNEVNGTCPKLIPNNLFNNYTMNGQVAVRYQYKCQTGPEYTKKHFYPAIQIQKAINNVKRRYPNFYGILDLYVYEALEAFPIRGKDVVVMGSQRPVYESMCIVFEGQSCTTIDFQRISAEDNRMRFLTLAEYSQKPELFDAGIAISSFEHDGLGRYGDPLRPDGDLHMMGKMKCIIRPGGTLYLSVPVSLDKVVWNMHRIYGQLRLPLLLKHWTLLKLYANYEWKLRYHEMWDSDKGDFEPLFVLKNEEPPPGHNEEILNSYRWM